MLLSNFVQTIIILICINMIAVLGVSVLTGFTNLYSFGNAGFMSIGAYTSALLSLRLGLPIGFAMIAGIIVAGIVAFLLGSITLKLRGDYFLIATIGFGESVRILFNYFSGLTGGAQGLVGIPAFPEIPGLRDFLGLGISPTLLIAFLCLILAVIIAWTFIHSKYGRNLSAISEQELAAEAVGVNVAKSKRMAFIFSAIFAGWAGTLYAHYMMYLTPAVFNMEKSSEMSIIVVIGGLNSLTGSMLGSLVITLLPEMFRELANYRMLFYGAAVVLIILLRPRGFMGYREFSPTGIVRWIRNRRNRGAVHSGGGKKS